MNAGADVNVRDEYLERTPLHFATGNDRLEAIAVLLAAAAVETLAEGAQKIVELAGGDS